MSRYDRSITVFSPDGRLQQVEYAMQAVEKGGAVVGVKGDDAVVLAVERRDVPELQDPRTLRKVVTLDKHIALAFAGLNADARVLVDMARVEAQSHRLTLEDAPTVEYMARHIAKLQQQYTQRGGRRPFGLSTLLAGFDADGSPRLWSTDPSGIHTGWSANAIGRSYKSLREYLEAHYKAGLKQQEAVKLALSTLLEVVTASAAGVEVLVATAEGHSKLEGADLEALIKEIEAEKAEAEEGAAGAAASST